MEVEIQRKDKNIREILSDYITDNNIDNFRESPIWSNAWRSC